MCILNMFCMIQITTRCKKWMFSFCWVEPGWILFMCINPAVSSIITDLHLIIMSYDESMWMWKHHVSWTLCWEQQKLYQTDETFTCYTKSTRQFLRFAECLLSEEQTGGVCMWGWRPCLFFFPWFMHHPQRSQRSFKYCLSSYTRLTFASESVRALK